MNFVTRVITMIMMIITIIILLVIAYYLVVDIQSKEPKQIKQNYEIETEEFSSRKVFVMKPKEKRENQKYILYFHGGSYVAETSEEHWDFLADLITDTQNTIIVPDYPLTPKYTYQDVFNMVVPLYQEMIQHINPDDMIMMGDSAGGGLALALEQKLGEEQINLPNQLILISPWLDVTMTNPKIDTIKTKDKELNKEALEVAGVAYAGKEGMSSYLVNPIHGPLENLKNVTIFTGTNDMLNPDVSVLVEKAKQVNVTIECKEYEGAEHVWIIRKNTASTETSEKAYQDLLKTLDK